MKDHSDTGGPEQLSGNPSNSSLVSRVKKARQAAISKSITEDLTAEEIEEERRCGIFISEHNFI